MALSYTAFLVMMLEIYVRGFCASIPYAGRNVGLWHIPAIVGQRRLALMQLG